MTSRHVPLANQPVDGWREIPGFRLPVAKEPRVLTRSEEPRKLIVVIRGSRDPTTVHMQYPAPLQPANVDVKIKGNAAVVKHPRRTNSACRPVPVSSLP